ncbi:hypothetical protein [Deinococcus misasensis]|uniref:hypothetical protein n=1 Tax=Deinococcus misasensis TaxID=392413 RepID=UPI0012F95C27|nr:hypothetical protein [Deinococcus misasensis]
MSWYPLHWTREQLEERRLNFALSSEKSLQHCKIACEHYRISVTTFYAWNSY